MNEYLKFLLIDHVSKCLHQLNVDLQLFFIIEVGRNFFRGA